ncbi:hypothetical protein M9458_050554 [Cirrhinus mrigala]|uniref:Uncharacterized protein n=1 Tax=Cirrhinus mrigala TaxID=683832 RepID=A0ABD0MYL7_CIRMR
MAAVSNVIPFGLLYMRPLQSCLKTKGVLPEGKPALHDQGHAAMPTCLGHVEETLVLVSGSSAGSSLSRHMLATDASLTSWGVVMSGHPARGLWSGHHPVWHFSCLEMLAVFQAVETTAKCICLGPAHCRARLLHSIWRFAATFQRGLPTLVGPEQGLVMEQEVDTLLRKAIEVVPPHVRESEFYSRYCIVLKKEGEVAFRSEEHIHPSTQEVPELHWGWMPWYRRGRGSVRTPFPDCSAPRSSGESALCFSLAGVLEVVGVAPEGAHLIASGLSTEVVETTLQSRAPSSRKLYALKWKPFTSWCGDRQQDSVNCPVGTVLGFLQDRFSTGLAHSTLKVYVAAISAYHAPLGGSSVGRNPLVTRFLRGVLFHTRQGFEVWWRETLRLGPYFRHPWSACFSIQKLPAACTARAFKLPGLYVTPPVTSRFSIGLYAHVFQSWSRWRRSHSVFDTASRSLGEPWLYM